MECINICINAPPFCNLKGERKINIKNILAGKVAWGNIAADLFCSINYLSPVIFYWAVTNGIVKTIFVSLC